MNWFWIVGVVVNVTLTGLAIWWVLRQMKPRPDAHHRADENPDGPAD
jgi:hypothetical protein